MRPCVGLDEVEVKGCGTSGELADGHADRTNPPSDLVKDYPSGLQININGDNDPDRSLVVGTQFSSSQSSLTPHGDSEGFGLPPVLLLLSPDIGRFEVSVLDVAAWSSSPSWTGCRLPDSPDSAACNTASGAAGFEPAYNDGNASADAGAVDSPNCEGQCTSSDEAVVATTDADAVEPTTVDPVHPMATACAGAPPRRITYPAPVARHAIRSVSVARVGGGHRVGPCVLDSPAGSTSTSISGTFRSCLRPTRTWTAGNACSPSPGEARPTKTVRWLDHVAMQAVAEAQSAGYCLPETPPGREEEGTAEAIHRNPDDTAATMDESCTSLYDATGLAVAQLSSLSSPGGLRRLLDTPEGTTDHDIGHEEMRTLEAILAGAGPPPSVPSQPQLQSNTYVKNPSLMELLSSSRSRSEQQQLPSQLHSQQENQPEQQEILHRLLSPQMLRALEHSQPISDIHTFNQTESSEPSIVIVQPRYAAAAEAAGGDDYPESCRVPLEWLNAGCFSDQQVDSSGNEDRSGAISVLDSSDNGCDNDPCGEFGRMGVDGWGQPQQPHLHYLHQHIQRQHEKDMEVQRRVSESEGARVQQGNSDGSRGVGGGGWGPGAADVERSERSACGVPASTSMLRTGSSASASFGFGGVGLISSESGRAALSEDAGRHIASTPASHEYIRASHLFVASADGTKRMNCSGNYGVLMTASAGIIGSNSGDLEREAAQAVSEPHQHDGEAQGTQQRLQTSLSGSRITRLAGAGEPEWDGAPEQSAVRLSDSKMQRMVALSGVGYGEPDTRAVGRSAASRAKHRHQGEAAAGDSQRGGQVDKGRGRGGGPLWRLTAAMACWARNVAPCIAARPTTTE